MIVVVVVAAAVVMIMVHVVHVDDVDEREFSVVDSALVMDEIAKHW